MKSLPIPRLTPEVTDRFWSKVNRAEPDVCWEWAASTQRRGYGQFSAGSRMVGAHRIAFFLGTGQQPTGLHVCHKCDNKRCCNPRHLFLGTNGDNMADKASKGLAWSPCLKGEKNGRSKLTTEEVLAIRESNETQTRLAKKYGVSQVRISQIQRRKAWKHV